jgi:hypothetical protein
MVLGGYTKGKTGRKKSKRFMNIIIGSIIPRIYFQEKCGTRKESSLQSSRRTGEYQAKWNTS